MLDQAGQQKRLSLVHFAIVLVVTLATASWIAATPSLGAVRPRLPRPTPSANPQHTAEPLSTPGPLGPTVDGISFALEPRVGPYYIGEPIYLGLYFHNTSRKPEYFRQRTEFRFEVSPSSEAVHSHDFISRGFDSHGRFDLAVGIGTGNSSPWEADLSTTHEIVQPGTYQVRAIIIVHQTRAVLTSPWVTISLLASRLKHTGN